MNLITHVVTVNDKGDRNWMVDGQLHRTDGPAAEYANGDKEWFLNGKRHRMDGPAVEWSNGTKLWFVNGQLHRTDGPAWEYSDGDRAWHLHGVSMNEDEWKKKTTPRTNCVDTVSYTIRSTPRCSALAVKQAKGVEFAHGDNEDAWRTLAYNLEAELNEVKSKVSNILATVV